MKKNSNMGRPSKLTPELEVEFVDLVKSGTYIETACLMVGIGQSTYYDWMKKADESTEPNAYTEFRDEVEKAKAWAEARDVTIISMHAKDNWRAAAWLLDRKYPERWGRKRHQKKRKVSGKPVVSPVHISPEHVPPGYQVHISPEHVPPRDRVWHEQALYFEMKYDGDLDESQEEEETDNEN